MRLGRHDRYSRKITRIQPSILVDCRGVGEEHYTAGSECDLTNTSLKAALCLQAHLGLYSIINGETASIDILAYEMTIIYAKSSLSHPS